MELAHVVHRAAIDPAFAQALLHDPQTTLATIHVSLDTEALDALLAIMHANPRWATLCSPDMRVGDIAPWRSAQLDG